MTNDDRPALHHVTVKHTRDADGEVASTQVTFECRGDRTSPCHQYPDCDCESWDAEHEKEHPKVSHEECVMKGWFDGGGCGENCYLLDDDFCLNPADIPERSGPVEIEWDECVSWSFADEVPA